MTSLTPSRSNNCLGRTCLKWMPDGSLSAVDHDALMRRLCEADPTLAGSEICSLDSNHSQQGS